MRNKHKLIFVCVATGRLYGLADQYINAMYGMLAKHTSEPFELRCYTDRPRAIDSRITQIDCSVWREFQRPGCHPTHYKLGLFNQAYNDCAEIYYLDLSLIIQAPLAPLIEFAQQQSEDLAIVKGWYRDSFNSCVMRIRAATLQYIYDDFVAGRTYPEHVPGDQDFICGAMHSRNQAAAFFPDDQIISFKKTMRQGLTDWSAARAKADGAAIVKFHGRPKTHQIFHPGYMAWHYRLKYLLRGAWHLPVDINRLRSNWLPPKA